MKKCKVILSKVFLLRKGTLNVLIELSLFDLLYLCSWSKINLQIPFVRNFLVFLSRIEKFEEFSLPFRIKIYHLLSHWREVSFNTLTRFPIIFLIGGWNEKVFSFLASPSMLFINFDMNSIVHLPEALSIISDLSYSIKRYFIKFLLILLKAWH